MQKTRNFAVWLLIGAISVLAGCASLPTPEEMKAASAGVQLPHSPEAGKGMIDVVRPTMFGGAIRFNVFFGNQEASSEVGYTRANQYIYFSVPPGQHTIYSKAENWADLTLTVKAGEVAFVQQHVAMGLVMARNTLAPLQEYEGKFHMRDLSVGTILKSDVGGPVSLASSTTATPVGSAPAPAAAIAQAAPRSGAPSVLTAAATDRPATAGTVAAASPAELAFWDAIKGSNNVAEYLAYLEQFPFGTFAPLARARIVAMGGTPPAAPVAVQPSRAAAPTPAATPKAPAPLAATAGPNAPQVGDT